VTAPSRKNIEKPVIKGFRVRWSLDKNFNEFEGETGILLCDSGTHVISVSNYGGTYYVCAYFVGEFEEGEPCPTIFIPLACNLNLNFSIYSTSYDSRSKFESNGAYIL
jgi:hypothetical protein